MARRHITVGMATGNHTPEEMLTRALRRAETGDLILVKPGTYDMTFVDYPDPLPNGLIIAKLDGEPMPIFVHSLEFLRDADKAKTVFGGIMLKPYAKGSETCQSSARN